MALLMVLVLITLLASVVFDFQFNSRIDLQLAVNARDELQAEYNARSALMLRAMLLKNATKIKGALGAIPGMDAGALPINQLLEMVPVECGLMSALVRKAQDPFFKVEEAAATLDEEGGGVFQGECIATSHSEHAKISLQALRTQGNTLQQQNPAYNTAAGLLLGLLSSPRYERWFQEDDRNGTHAESPAELVGAIIDWMDSNNDQELSPTADEGRFYARLRHDSYRVKNAFFDSVAELQLVHGVNDEVYHLLKDNVSIYTTGNQIELGTASNEQIMQIIMALGAGQNLSMARDLDNCAEFRSATCEAMARFYYELQMARMMSMGMFNTAMLQQLITASGLGTFFPPQHVSQIFTDKASTVWYTIDAQGRMGNATSRIKAVFQAAEGRFHYMRIE